MKKLILWCSFSFLAVTTNAQEQFIAKGRIEFEKKVNLHKKIENTEANETWRNMLKKTAPEYKTTYFDLYFNENKTIYKPGREVVVTQKIPEWIEGPASDNIVFTDLLNETVNSQKTVFESTFNIQDSIRKIEWKITTDGRTIAGFDCKKATAIIMDSIFVVAFYTDQITTSGGPESFAGLPGMILGIALPRMNTTYFATKVELVDVNETVLTPPKKGKKITINDLKSQLKSSMKNWGKEGARNTWQVMI